MPGDQLLRVGSLSRVSFRTTDQQESSKYRAHDFVELSSIVEDLDIEEFGVYNFLEKSLVIGGNFGRILASPIGEGIKEGDLGWERGILFYG